MNGSVYKKSFNTIMFYPATKLNSPKFRDREFLGSDPKPISISVGNSDDEWYESYYPAVSIFLAFPACSRQRKTEFLESERKGK